MTKMIHLATTAEHSKETDIVTNVHTEIRVVGLAKFSPSSKTDIEALTSSKTTATCSHSICATDSNIT